MPKAVIESMALGIPPIITNIPGNNELVTDEKCGLIVPPKNPEALCQAILKMYHDRVLCKELGKNGQLRIKNHFNLDQSIQKTKELYEELAFEKA